VHGWRKELQGGSVAVALVNMGLNGSSTRPNGHISSGSNGHISSGSNGSIDCEWNYTKGAYAEACGGRGGDIFCGQLGGAEEAKRRCCADPACTTFSIATSDQGTKPVGFGCLKSNGDCGSTINAAYDGYSKTKQADLSRNVSLHFTDVGFSPYTRVKVRDLFAHQDLGVFVGSFSSTASVPLHGVLMLKLTFEPMYPGREL
jgi:hypothetical protein